MLRIHLASIAETGLTIDEQVDSLSLPLLADVSRHGSAEFTRPIQAQIRATLAGESVQIDGRVQTVVRLTCSRCLVPFELTIATTFTATAMAEKPVSPKAGSTEEIELSADEMDVIPYAGDSIDLGEEISQQIIMALPYKPLCRDTCKGLCSGCGVDLNDHACRCHDPDRSSPFAVLKTRTFPPKKD